MEEHDIDLGLREVFNRNTPSFEQAEADLISRTANLRKVARGRGRGILRLASVTVAVLVVAVGAAGIWQVIAHFEGNNPIVLITDQTISTGPTGATTTPASAPQPQPAFTWPHSYPGPVYVSTQAAQQAAELVVDYLPDLKLTVERAVEQEGAAVYLLDFGTSQRDGSLTCSLFQGGGAPLSSAGGGQKGETVQVEGAIEAFVVGKPQQSQWQLLARLTDGTIVNLISTGPRINGVSMSTTLLTRAQGEDLAAYLVSLLLSGKITLPKATTTTTVPTIFLARDVSNACGESSMNLLAYVAQGRKTDFAKLLVPAAQGEADSIWTSERQRFKASGLSADEYDAYAGIAVQWKDGAYLTLDGYFVQTDPAIRSEVTAWLSEDPAGRAAYGVQLWDKSLRWLRLEGQPDGKWLIVP